MTLRGRTASYSYDAAGRLAERILPNGMKVAYAYDLADRVSSIEYRKADDSPVETLSYAYDAGGQRRQRGTGTSPLLETPFSATYDEANRLTVITLNGEVLTLAYDDNGNLASKSGPASGTTTYTWDARSQLTSISGPAGSAAFRYDALGRRIEKTVNGVTTGFLYDGAQAIAELKGSSLDTVYHTGLEIDEVLARYGAAGNKTLLTDALMSVIAQANDDESVANYYAYSPYGEATTLGPDEGNPLQYTGRENDGTGLYYYRARYYDPVLKRFIAEDPIGIAAGPNFYAYVNGDPVSLIDPTGNVGIGGVLAGIAIVVGGYYVYQGYQGIQSGMQANEVKNDFYSQVANNPSSVSANAAGQAIQAQAQALQAAGQVGNAAANVLYPPLVTPATRVPVPNLPVSSVPGTGNSPRYPILPTNNPNGQVYCPGYNR